MHGEPDNDDNDSDYHPDTDNSNDSSDSSSHQSSHNNDNESTASRHDIKITGVDDNIDTDENTTELTGVDDNTDMHKNNHNKHNADAEHDNNTAIDGKNNKKEAEAEYNPSTDMAGVEDNTDNDKDINDETNNGNHNDHFGFGIRMKLHNQPHWEYNVFNITFEIESEHLMMLHFDDNMGITEENMDKTEAEWMFLTEQLEWKEGLQKEGQLRPTKAECKKNNVRLEAITLLAEHLFLTQQMGWRKGLKVVQDKGEEAIKRELQLIHDMKGFKPKYWFEMTQQERARALKYLMRLKEKRD